MKSRLFNFVRIGGIVLTLVVLVAEKYLPAKQLDLYPSKLANLELFSDGDYGGESRAEWIAQSKAQWRCTLVDSQVSPVCGASIVFSSKPYKTLDFSAYDDLILSLSYRGDAKKLRVYMRNHNPAYSTLYDIESAKFESATVRVADIQSTDTVRIQLKEFAVADWWLDNYSIAREQAGPDFSAVMSVGVDQPGAPVLGEHYYQLNRLTLTGAWVKPAQLYLAIIFGWMIILGVEAGVYLLTFRKRLAATITTSPDLNARHYSALGLSGTDRLTGLINPAGLSEIIKTIAGSRDGTAGMGVIAMAIDDFAALVEPRGGAVAERVIKAFAERVRDSIRADDIFVRWSEQQFILLAHTSEPDSVRSLAEKIRLSVQAFAFDPEHPLNLTLSLGVAFIADGESCESAVSRSMACLAEAHDQGGDRCIVECPSAES